MVVKDPGKPLLGFHTREMKTRLHKNLRWNVCTSLTQIVPNLKMISIYSKGYY